MLICAAASLALPRATAALLVLFQGGLALPAAFLLERRMAWKPMAADNPLRPLAIQLAMSQIVALPIAIAAYSMNPGAVPLAMAAIGGGHFLPYAWLQRSRAYAALAVAVSAGAFALQIALGRDAFPIVLVWMSACYFAAAPVVYRTAAAYARPALTAR
jgi:hypothetical protein